MWRSLHRSSIIYKTNQALSLNSITKLNEINYNYLFKPIFLNNNNSLILKKYQSNQTTSQVDDQFKPKLPKFEKPQPKKQSKLYSFITVFASGIVAYAAISFLFGQKGKEKQIDKSIKYDAKHLPGLVTPSKSVKLF